MQGPMTETQAETIDVTEIPYAPIRPDGLPTIGMAIIAKDEEATLPRLLDSIGFAEVDPERLKREKIEGGGMRRFESAVDFVVVCDTGSSDATKDIARARGCRVIDTPWNDDFSEARTASYAALPDWIAWSLWGDCDDIIEDAEKLHRLAAMLHQQPEVSGSLHRYDYARDEAGNCICELWRERLVRFNHGEKWMLAIHEVLQVPGALVHVDEVVWHHHQPPGREKDPERNYKILRKSYERSTERGEQNDLRTIAYLGTEALTLGRPEEAVELFKQFLGRKDALNPEERCQVAHKLSIALRTTKEGEKEPTPQAIEEALEAGHLAIHEKPDWPDGYIDLAELSLRREEPERALAFCDQAISRDLPKTLLIINPLEYQYQPLLMRSVALAKLGRIDEAVTATQEALSITPQREDLAQQMGLVMEQKKRKDAVEAILSLREMLVRHDENAKAEALMTAAVPYFIEADPQIAAARLDQREMVLHATDPEAYGSYYRENPNETPFENTGVEIEKAHEAFHRVQFLREGLDKQAEHRGGENAKAGLRILDLSCNDGWMLANLALGGYGVKGQLHGMDMNLDASSRAQDRLDNLAGDGGDRRVAQGDLHTAPEHFEEGGYDAVVLFETLEHVPDPAATMDLLARMVNPGGQVYISTPHGAYENGNVPNWAHVESKGHLRAMMPREVAALMNERGKITAMTSEQRLIVGSFNPRERFAKVVFFGGPADARPEQILESGLGGSETAMCKMAEHFARRGYDVRVYAGEGGGVRQDHLTVEGEETEGVVLYEPASMWDPGEPCDLFISLRMPEVFDRTIKAPRRVLWLHDADYGERLTEKRIERATHVAVLSDFHREIMVEKYPFIEDKVFLTRNGIETDFYSVPVADGKGPTVLPVEKRKPWLVYSSSPDRGLDVLLEMWPTIRDKAERAGVSSPELHFTYSPIYKQFRDSGQFPHLSAFHARIEQLRAEIGEDGGLVDHDSMNQHDLADLFLEATIWAYPSWTTPSGEPFPEISCIGAMEAQAGGCIPVCSDYGALKETVVSGTRIEPTIYKHKLSPEWRDLFIDAVVQYLADPERCAEERVTGREFAMNRDWGIVATQWMQEFLWADVPSQTDQEVSV